MGKTKFFHSEIFQNSAKMLSANAIAQAVGILFYPLLTRLYSAEDFGVLNLFLSIGGVLLLLATADYQYAILLPKSDKKAASVLQLASLISLSVVALCSISIFFRHPISRMFKAPELADFYPLLPLFVLFSAAWTLLNYWFTRKKQFGAISRYQVGQNLGNAVFKYGFGAAGFLRWGLFVSTILSLALSLGISVRTTFKSWKNSLLHFEPKPIRTAARRYARFPLFSLPRSIVNNLSSNLPIFLLTPFFGLTELGYFGMALTLAFRPVNMIAASLYQVFFQRFAENLQNRLPIRSFFRKFVLRTLIIVIPGFTLLYFVLPDLCAWLLGSGWEMSGEYIRLMLPWIGMVCVGSCISFISDLFQKQSTMLGIEIAYLILRTAGLCIGIALDRIDLSILLFSLSGALIIAVQLIWYRKLIIHYETTL